jgi:hypothetical protein
MVQYGGPGKELEKFRGAFHKAVESETGTSTPASAH